MQHFCSECLFVVSAGLQNIFRVMQRVSKLPGSALDRLPSNPLTDNDFPLSIVKFNLISLVNMTLKVRI